MHTGHRKRYRYQGAPHPHPPPPPLMHNLHALPSPPVLHDRHPVCICICLVKEGILEKGGTMPIWSLLNTFVSTTHGEKQDRQAAARKCSTATEVLQEMLLCCLNVFFLIEKKGWKVAAVIDSVSIQSPGYNGGRALERSWSVRWWSISTVAVASLTHVATLVRIQKGANAGMDKYRAEQCSNNTSKNVVQNSCNLFL